MKIAYYLPDKVLTNEDLEREFDDWSASKIEEKVGIRQRHIAGPDETALDLAVKACEAVLVDQDKNTIDFILLCTQSPDYFLPTTACILQERLGLKNGCGALDFNLGCSGFIYGLALAKGLLTIGTASRILLVTAETYSKHMHPNDRANRSIFGDAAAAILLDKHDIESIGVFEMGTDGKGKDHLIVERGGMRNFNKSKESSLTDETGANHSPDHLFMNGPEIFNFTIDTIPALANTILEKNNLSFDKIDYVIFHQANKYMLEYLRKKIKIPIEKYHNNMLMTGNTVSSTIPIAIKDSADAAIIKPGDKLLLVGFGVGLSWGGVVLEWK
jgi:3-oxoacyl-[acyl-carrier-protein] synthase-3